LAFCGNKQSILHGNSLRPAVAFANVNSQNTANSGRRMPYWARVMRTSENFSASDA